MPMEASALSDVLRNAIRNLENASRRINSLDEPPELAFYEIGEAEKLLRSILELEREEQLVEYVKKQIQMALAETEPPEERPLYIAKVALQALVLYERQEIVERLPQWDIEAFRASAQKAKWRQDAASRVSQVLGGLSRVLRYLQTQMPLQERDSK